MSKQQSATADEERKASTAMQVKSRKQFELWAHIDMGKGWPFLQPHWYRVGWYRTAQARNQARDHMTHENELRGWKTQFSNGSPNAN